MYSDDFNDSYKIDQAVATLQYTMAFQWEVNKQTETCLGVCNFFRVFKVKTFLLCKILDEGGLWLAGIEPETKKNELNSIFFSLSCQHLQYCYLEDSFTAVGGPWSSHSLQRDVQGLQND